MNFFSQVTAPWVGTSNVNTPTVTSQIPQFLEQYLSTMLGYLGVQDGIEDGILLPNMKAFLDGLFHTQEIFKSTTHNRSAPHEFDHDISAPSPDGQMFMATALFQQAKTKGDVADNLSGGAIVHSAPLTKFLVTGHYQVRPGIFKKNNSTQQSTWMALEDGGSAAVALEDGGNLVALGGGVRRQFKIAVVALGSGGGRRTCIDGRQHQHC
jgi:hypothetical protein